MGSSGFKADKGGEAVDLKGVGLVCCVCSSLLVVEVEGLREVRWSQGTVQSHLLWKRASLTCVWLGDLSTGGELGDSPSPEPHPL